VKIICQVFFAEMANLRGNEGKNKRSSKAIEFPFKHSIIWSPNTELCAFQGPRLQQGSFRLKKVL
jgi:hypothetical protein